MTGSPSLPPLGRRSFLGLAAGVAGAGVLAACGDNTGRQTSTGGGTSASSSLSQWYHQYGEAGVQQTVEGYAKAYPGASVTVQWNPGDYDKKVASALLTDGRPRRLRERQRSVHRHDPGRPGGRPDRHPR